MLTIDLVIGIFLTFLGASVLIYILYTLIRKQDVKMSPLYISEALATIILGIFYVVCSCIIGTTPTMTSVTSSETPTTRSFLTTEPAYDPVEEKALTDLYNPDNFYNMSFTSESHVNTNQLLDDFIKYYKESFGNTSLGYGDTIRKLIAINRLGKKIIMHKSHHHHHAKEELNDIDLEEGTESTGTHEGMETIEKEEEDCSVYDEIYFKYMMLVVSFVYGVISVINSTIQCKSCSVKPGDLTTDKVFVKKQDEEDKTRGQEKQKYDFKSFMQVVLAWLVPVIYAIIVSLTMKPNEVFVEFFEISHIRDAPSDIVNFIEHPLNVSHMLGNSTQREEMNSVIDRIYEIMQHVQNQDIIDEELNKTTEKPYDILETINNLRGKISGKQRSTTEEPAETAQTHRKCSLELMPIKLHTLIVFILSYFVSIFYVKVTHAKLAMIDKEQEQVKLLGKYIVAFASLWLPSMLEIFLRTYLMETKPTVATDITLALGNVTRILANGINVRNVHKVIQKFNNVRPASECV